MVQHQREQDKHDNEAAEAIDIQHAPAPHTRHDDDQRQQERGNPSQDERHPVLQGLCRDGVEVAAGNITLHRQRMDVVEHLGARRDDDVPAAHRFRIEAAHQHIDIACCRDRLVIDRIVRLVDRGRAFLHVGDLRRKARDDTDRTVGREREARAEIERMVQRQQRNRAGILPQSPRRNDRGVIAHRAVLAGHRAQENPSAIFGESRKEFVAADGFLVIVQEAVEEDPLRAGIHQIADYLGVVRTRNVEDLEFLKRLSVLQDHDDLALGGVHAKPGPAIDQNVLQREACAGNAQKHAGQHRPEDDPESGAFPDFSGPRAEVRHDGLANSSPLRPFAGYGLPPRKASAFQSCTGDLLCSCTSCE